MTADAAPPSAGSPEAPLRYGFRAGGCAVRPDEARWFGMLLTDLALRLEPCDRLEADLMEALAVLELKLARLDALELRVLAGDDEDGAARLPSLTTLVRYRSQLLKERAEIDRRLDHFVEARGTNEAEADDAGPTDPQEARRRAELRDAAGRILARSWQQPMAGGAEGPVPPALNRHERRRHEAEQRRAA